MPLILPGNVGSATAATGYNVANSVRLFSNTFLHKTPTGDSNKQVFTFSTWLKRGNITAEMGIFTAGNDSNSNGFFTVMFTDADELNIQFYDGAFDDLKTNRKFRDVSAWYHIVVAVDTTDGTAANRIKVYVNGVQESSFASSDYPDENQNFDINEDANDVYVGVRRNSGGSPAGYYDGYIAEAVLIDGSQLAADQFGEFDSDSGIWKPIDVSGLTFGTNGFYLDFEDSGNLGNDANGGTDLTENNIVATDQSTDTCTLNYNAMNPLDNFYSGATFSEGNIKVSSARYAGVTSTFALTKGKWYFEYKCVSRAGTSGFVGITSATATATNYEFGNQSGENVGYSVSLHNGSVYGNGGQVAAAGTFETIEGGDFGMVALDFDNNKIYYGKDGTWGNSQDPANGTNALSIVAVTQGASGHWRIYVGGETNNATVFEMNFGSPPYAISSGNTDGDGYGNFEYAVPSGYYALNTKNLAEYG